MLKLSDCTVKRGNVFHAPKNIVFLNQDIINDLIVVANKHPLQRARLCLHQTDQHIDKATVVL